MTDGINDASNTFHFFQRLAKVEHKHFRCSNGHLLSCPAHLVASNMFCEACKEFNDDITEITKEQLDIYLKEMRSK